MRPVAGLRKSLAPELIHCHFGIEQYIGILGYYLLFLLDFLENIVIKVVPLIIFSVFRESIVMSVFFVSTMVSHSEQIVNRVFLLKFGHMISEIKVP